MWNLPSNWLDNFKLQIRYPYTNMDPILNSYLDLALTNIMTQYLEIEEDAITQSLVDEITSDNRVMLATFHIANTLYSNPDINNVNNFGTLIDSDNIYRILGNRVDYFKAYPQATNLDVNTQSQLSAFKTDLLNSVNQVTSSLTSELSTLTENDTNLQSQIDTLNSTTTNLSNSINDLTTSNTNLTNQVTDLSNSNTDLTNQVNNLNSDLTTAKTDLTNQINQVSSDLSTAKSDLTNQITSLSDTTTQLNIDLTDLTSKVSDLTTSNADLQSSVTDLQTTTNQLNTNLTNLSSQVSTLATNQTQMQNLLNGFNKEMDLTGNLYQIARYSSNEVGLFNCVLQQDFDTITSLNILAIVLTFPQTSPNLSFYGINFRKDPDSGKLTIITSGNYSDMLQTGVNSPYICKIIYNENSTSED